MESKLKFIETSKLPTDVGEFTVHAFTDEKDSKDHLAIGMGDLLTNEPVLSRIQKNLKLLKLWALLLINEYHFTLVPINTMRNIYQLKLRSLAI